MNLDLGTVISGVCGLLVAIVTQGAFVYVQIVSSRSTHETNSQRIAREERLTHELIAVLQQDVRGLSQRADAAEQRADAAERLLSNTNHKGET